MKNLLLVEDDLSLGATLRERLEKEGYAVTWSKTLAQAATDFRAKPMDLVILDVGLPDGSGFDFAATIRAESFTPFLFVTAQAGAPERLRGFEVGAEEYIPKPFHLKEILLRVRHVLDNHAHRRTVKCGARTIDFERMAVIGPGDQVETLPFREFRVLRHLIAVSPRVVSRDEIQDTVWGEENASSNRTIDNVILRLRQMLGDDGTQLIKSVRGVGYQWIGARNE